MAKTAEEKKEAKRAANARYAAKKKAAAISKRNKGK